MIDIFIAQPLYRTGPDPSALCALMRLRGALPSTSYNVVHNAPVETARAELTANFLASGSPMLLWLDGDISVGTRAVLTMARLDLPIVAAPYRKRRPPHAWCLADDLSSLSLRERHGVGYARVKRVGIGCSLMRRDAVARIVGHYPELQVRSTLHDGTVSAIWHRLIAGGEWLGEDYSFCERACEAGVEPAALIGAEVDHAGVRDVFRLYGQVPDQEPPSVCTIAHGAPEGQA